LKDGLKIGGETYPVEIIVRDSQSNPNRAAEVAKELIVKDKIDLMTVASTPETTNPVSTQCEIEELPCISTVAPWQPYFIGRQANPGDPKSWKPFDSTFHFFWGLEDIIAAYTNIWAQIETNKVVGGLFPNDGDGNAWGDKVVGFPPVLDKLGYKLVDPAASRTSTDCQIVTGVAIPPDFTTFWNQANQRGFKPRVASAGKAMLFPSALEALGKSGHNLSTEIWWTPTYPFKSSLTDVSSACGASSGSAGTFCSPRRSFAGIDPLLAVPLAGIFAALVALPSAWLIFRWEGAYFAIGTWVLTEVFRLTAAQIKPLGGRTGASLSKTVADAVALVRAIASASGMRVSAARDVAACWLALVLVVLATALVYLLLRSRRGLALAAIRDDPAAASSLGVDPFRLKLMVYVLCAFGAGMTGALIYLQKARISPDAAFSVLDWTAYIMFIVIIGGVATVVYRCAGLLRSARTIVGFRRRLFNSPRRGRDCGQGVLSEGFVGLLGRALRSPRFSGTQATHVDDGAARNIGVTPRAHRSGEAGNGS
jgi:ABC-type branched-subunit amino acid transport system permease subunit